MELAYDRRGAGEPLVLIHPLGTDRHVWDPVLDLLAAQRDVVAVDLPGFGAAPVLDAGIAPTPAALAEAVRGFSAGLAIERPHVAGISLGGWVALEATLAGWTRSVTAICCAGLWPQPLRPKPGIARGVARAALPLVATLVRSAAGRRIVLGGIVARPENVPPEAALHLVRTYAKSPGFRAVNDAMRAGRFAALDRVRAPLTLAWAERDRLVAPPAHVPPTARTVLLRGCGHVPTWDDPEAVARAVLAGSRGRS